MKIYALYYKDTFVVAYPNRADCVSYGQKHYEGMEWDCNIVEKYLHDYPKFIDTTPSTLYASQHIPCTQPIQMNPTKEQNIPNIWCQGAKATNE